MVLISTARLLSAYNKVQQITTIFCQLLRCMNEDCACAIPEYHAGRARGFLGCGCPDTCCTLLYVNNNRAVLMSTESRTVTLILEGHGACSHQKHMSLDVEIKSGPIDALLACGNLHVCARPCALVCMQKSQVRSSYMQAVIQPGRDSAYL